MDQHENFWSCPERLRVQAAGLSLSICKPTQYHGKPPQIIFQFLCLYYKSFVGH